MSILTQNPLFDIIFMSTILFSFYLCNSDAFSTLCAKLRKTVSSMMHGIMDFYFYCLPRSWHFAIAFVHMPVKLWGAAIFWPSLFVFIYVLAALDAHPFIYFPPTRGSFQSGSTDSAPDLDIDSYGSVDCSCFSGHSVMSCSCSIATAMRKFVRNSRAVRKAERLAKSKKWFGKKSFQALPMDFSIEMLNFVVATSEFLYLMLTMKTIRDRIMVFHLYVTGLKLDFSKDDVIEFIHKYIGDGCPFVPVDISSDEYLAEYEASKRIFDQFNGVDLESRPELSKHFAKCEAFLRQHKENLMNQRVRFQAFEEAANSAAGFRSSWKTVLHSDLGNNLQKIIGMVVSMVICKQNPSDLRYSHSIAERLGISIVVPSPIGVADCVIDTIECVLSKIHLFSKTGRVMDFFARDVLLIDIEKTLVDIKGHFESVLIGHFELGPFKDAADFSGILDDVINQLEGLASKEKNKLPRMWLTDRLTEMLRIRVKFYHANANKGLRVQPYSLLLYGTSGVGKSALCSQLTKIILAANGFASDSKNVTSLNLEDKYQSDYRPCHNAIILDDIVNAKLEHSNVNPAQMIINLINNVPMAALQADVANKGMIMLEPKVVMGTTNCKDIKSTLLSNEPVSILRRFNHTLTVQVKPEFCKDGSTMLDPSKVPPSHVMDVWNVKVESVFPITVGKKQTVGYKTIGTYGFDDLCDLVIEGSRAHFQQQKRVCAGSEKIYSTELCEHFKYPSLCALCKPTLQAGLDWVNSYHEYGLGSDHQPVEETAFSQFINLFMPYFLHMGRLTSLGMSLWSRDPFTAITRLLVGFTFCIVLFVCAVFGSFHGSFLRALLSFSIASTIFAIFLHVCIQFVYFYRISQIGYVPVSYMVKLSQWGVTRKRLVFFTMGLAALGGILILLKPLARSSFNAVSEGKDLPPDEVQRVNHWKQTPRVKIPVSTPAATTSFEDLTGIMSNCVRSIRIPTEGGTIHSNITSICSNMWVMNAHIWNSRPTGQDFLDMEVWRGDAVMFNCNKVSLRLYSRNVYVVPGTDLAFFLFTAGGSVKNIRPWLISNKHIPSVRGVFGTVIHRNLEGLIKHFNARNVRSSPNYCVDKVYSSTLEYDLGEHKSFNGLCGSPIIADREQTFITGIHYAGILGTNKGAIHALCIEHVEEALERLEAKSTSVPFHSSGTFSTDTLGVSYTLKDVHPKSVTNFLPDGSNMDIYGTTGSRRTMRSDIVESFISDKVTSIMGVPRQHGAPPNMNDSKHFQRHATNISNVNENLDVNMLAKAQQDMMRDVDDLCSKHQGGLRRVVPLSENANCGGLMGVWGIDAQKQTSSAGFPLNKAKSLYFVEEAPATSTENARIKLDALVHDEIDRITESYLKGERAYMIFRANLKDEATSFKKDKVRVFAGAPIAFSYLIRKYFLAAIVFIQSHPLEMECAVGVNAHGPDWTKLMRGLEKFGTSTGVAVTIRRMTQRVRQLSCQHHTKYCCTLLKGPMPFTGSSQRTTLR